MLRISLHNFLYTSQNWKKLSMRLIKFLHSWITNNKHLFSCWFNFHLFFGNAEDCLCNETSHSRQILSRYSTYIPFIYLVLVHISVGNFLSGFVMKIIGSGELNNCRHHYSSHNNVVCFQWKFAHQACCKHKNYTVVFYRGFPTC